MRGKRNGKMVEPVARIEFRCSEELKELIGKSADKEGLPMNEYLAKVVADHLGRPDLAEIPRISMGRPRKQPA